MSFLEINFENSIGADTADVLKDELLGRQGYKLYYGHWSGPDCIEPFSLDIIDWGEKCPDLVFWECVRKYFTAFDVPMFPEDGVKSALLKTRRRVESAESAFRARKAAYEANPRKRQREIEDANKAFNKAFDRYLKKQTPKRDIEYCPELPAF